MCNCLTSVRASAFMVWCISYHGLPWHLHTAHMEHAPAFQFCIEGTEVQSFCGLTVIT